MSFEDIYIYTDTAIVLLTNLLISKLEKVLDGE